jgi:hypothetical protein
MSDNDYLIVVRSSSENDEIRNLLTLLGDKYQIDSFTARQRLVGRGPALLARSEPGKLTGLAELVGQHGIQPHIIRPTTPPHAPFRVRQVTICEDYLEFSDPAEPLRIERGDRILAVLADLSGRIISKNLSQLMVQNTYRGMAGISPMTDLDLQKEVLRSHPVLDLYVLNESQGVTTALRLVTGGFNPQGLGERASLSSTGNMQQLLELVGEYAGEFILDCDFGLALLPGCQLRRPEDGDDARAANLKALTRYGWLMSDLVLQKQAPESSQQGAELSAFPLHEVIREEIEKEDEASSPPEGDLEKVTLPPPPEPALASRRWSWRRVLPVAVAVVAVAGVFSQGAHELIGKVFFEGLRTGALPALFSAALFVGGFYCLRLKRLIENTPTSRIRSMAMGMVELHGRARRKYALVSPATQTACVWYRLRRYRRNRKSGWQLFRQSDSGAVPFLLDDGTGAVTINPDGARVRARVCQEGFPGQEGLMVPSWSGTDPDEKWVEEVIHEGTSLYVLGTARPLKKAGPSLGERLREALRELKNDPQMLKKYDRNGDGRLDTDEWDAARADVEEKILHAQLRQRETPLPGSATVEIGRSYSHTRPFMISQTESEMHLTRSYTWSMAGLFVGALIAAVWALKNFLEAVGFAG